MTIFIFILDIVLVDVVPKEEFQRIKSTLAEYKDQIASLKDDNARKAKLLSSMKSTKNADNSALEQWKQEATDAEENIKR